jgi:hypothetical protein
VKKKNKLCVMCKEEYSIVEMNGRAFCIKCFDKALSEVIPKMARAARGNKP